MELILWSNLSILLYSDLNHTRTSTDFSKNCIEVVLLIFLVIDRLKIVLEIP